VNHRLLPVLIFAAVISGVFAQAPGGGEGTAGRSGSAGDSPAAERYLVWAEEAAAGGRWAEALAALERAADFADVSSDLSYLLALARSHEGKSRGSALEALERGLEVNRWNHYGPVRALLLKAEHLVALRDYSGVLAALARVPDSADAAVLRLAALRGRAGASFPFRADFRLALNEAMNRYPRDPRPFRIFFEYARNHSPHENDRDLIDLALRRLPFLLEADPELAWMAAPFIRDTEEARRLTAAYRAGGLGPSQGGNFRPNPASIPAALNLGLIGDEEAAAELFAPSPDFGGEPRTDGLFSTGGSSPGLRNNGAGFVIDRDLILAVSDLLRSEAGRNLFAQKLLSFSGTITVDEDMDGFPESRAVYQAGTIQYYGHDADQDGLEDLRVFFDAGGSPRQAEQVMPREIGAGAAVPPALPSGDGDRSVASIQWERYPSVLRVRRDGAVFTPRPGDFQFAPIRFTELAGSGRYRGLSLPLWDSRYPRLTARTLVSFAVRIERSSVEFEGAVETIDIERGIPRRAVETLNGRIVSETEFENGRPARRRVDLDLDGRMETLQRFRRTESGGDPLEYAGTIEFSESDWDGDGIYENAEEYRQDGSVVYSWDMDRDGIREYSETTDRKLEKR
jgi:tetratricopeptide (TPR) repeat protein